MASTIDTENQAPTSAPVTVSKNQPDSKTRSTFDTNGKSWFWKFTFYFGPDLISVALFTVLLSVLLAVFGSRITINQAPIIYPLILMLLLMVGSFSVRVRKIFSRDRQAKKEFFNESLAMIRDWLPMVWLAFVYENLHDLTKLIRPTVVDGGLRVIDEAIFGVEPTLILQKITTPLLSEYLTCCYALYFVFPIACLGIIYYRKEFTRFRELFLSLSLCFYLGFLGYLLVPAIGPRHYMAEDFSVPITGFWITELAAQAWNSLELVQRDCFPSLHTAISTIACIYLWRYRNIWKHGKILFAICLPFIVSLWFSTVYLRYHWVIDVVAGWILALFCSWIAPRFIQWYYQKKTSTIPDVSINLR
jgi:membrane-associated phospholipid phosphatase